LSRSHVHSCESDQTESVSSRYIAGLDPDQTIGNIVPQLLETDDAEDDTDTNASRQPSGSSPVLLTPYGGPAGPDPDSFGRTTQSTSPNSRERKSLCVSRHQLPAAIAQAQGLLSGSGLHVSPLSSSQVATGQTRVRVTFKEIVEQTIGKDDKPGEN
ncbi:hypothetical protein X801_07600, partial [Opisthorchis viverrini]